MPSSYALGEHFEQFIKRQVESGRYSSTSEVIREALRLLEDREKLWEIQLEELRRQIQEGLNSGPGIPAEEVFAELRARYGAMTKQQGS